MGLDTKTYWLIDRQSQCDFEFDFDIDFWAVSRRTRMRMERVLGTPGRSVQLKIDFELL
jgi:hypothetical protein